MYYGIAPTYILILDPFEQWSDLSGIDWTKTNTKLITHQKQPPHEKVSIIFPLHYGNAAGYT